MSTKRRTITAIVLSVAIVALVAIIVVVVIGIVFLRSHREAVGVTAATEVGTPVGDKVTKDIGPAGGTLASPDGRLTLTVPENALTETVTFGIQPVTNNFELGMGLAYKLEPDTKTFSTPLDISIRYDDKDLEGTFPDALSLAYQDDKGAWHMQKEIDLDEENKTISVSTTHFSVWSGATTLKLSPSKATVRVGETVRLSLKECDESLFGKLYFLLNGGDGCSNGAFPSDAQWGKKGDGTLEHKYGSWWGIYTAPPKKPTPNVAIVFVDHPNFAVRVERPCTNSDGHIGGKNDQKWILPKKCYDRVPSNKSVEAIITIVDRGYRVSGNAGGDTVFSGVICDLEKPFTVKNSNPFLGGVDFVPSSSTAGTWKFSTKNGVTGGGHGKYTIEGSDTEKTGIVLDGDSTACIPYGCKSGGGTVHLTLTPLTSDDGGCGE